MRLLSRRAEDGERLAVGPGADEVVVEIEGIGRLRNRCRVSTD